MSGQSRNWVRLAVQAVGFGLCIAIVVWLVRVATTGEQAKALEQLRHISSGQIATLIGLSVLTLGLNGLLFWVACRPARWSHKVSLSGILATNSLATLLAYLPFKVSAAVRMGIHLRRDGVSLAQMVAWFGCFFAAMIGTIGPMAAASVWRGQMDGGWWLIAGGGLLGCFVASLVVARVFGGETGHRWLRRASEAGPWRRLLTPIRVEELHESFVIIGHPGWLAAAYAIRVVDLLAQSVRFTAASRAVGEAMQLGDAVVVAVGYYAMLVLSPFGALGAREAGAVGAGAMLDAADGSDGEGSLAAITLAVTGAEVVTLLVCGLAGLAWLGPGVLRGTAGTAGGTTIRSDEETAPGEL